MNEKDKLRKLLEETKIEAINKTITHKEVPGADGYLIIVKMGDKEVARVVPGAITNGSVEYDFAYEITNGSLKPSQVYDCIVVAHSDNTDIGSVEKKFKIKLDDKAEALSLLEPPATDTITPTENGVKAKRPVKSLMLALLLALLGLGGLITILTWPRSSDRKSDEVEATKSAGSIRPAHRNCDRTGGETNYGMTGIQVGSTPNITIQASNVLISVNVSNNAHGQINILSGDNNNGKVRSGEDRETYILPPPVVVEPILVKPRTTRHAHHVVTNQSPAIVTNGPPQASISPVERNPNPTCDWQNQSPPPAAYAVQNPNASPGWAGPAVSCGPNYGATYSQVSYGYGYGAPTIGYCCSTPIVIGVGVGQGYGYRGRSCYVPPRGPAHARSYGGYVNSTPHAYGYNVCQPQTRTAPVQINSYCYPIGGSVGQSGGGHGGRSGGRR